MQDIGWHEPRDGELAVVGQSFNFERQRLFVRNLQSRPRLRRSTTTSSITRTSDWYTAQHPEGHDKPCCVPQDPRGGSEESSLDPAQPQFRIPRKVIKGGSYLCADSYCMRYRPAARRPQMIDTGMSSHIGIRCLRREAGVNLTSPVTRER